MNTLPPGISRVLEMLPLAGSILRSTVKGSPSSESFVSTIEMKSVFISGKVES